MLTLKHLGMIERSDPFMGETLRAIQNAVNQHGVTVGVDPTGSYPAPAAPASLVVTVPQTGVFDAVITDPNPVRGVEYWLEWDSTAGFLAPRQIHLVGSRNWYGFLGSLTLYWRAASQFFGSDLSGWTVYGGANPIALNGAAPAGALVQPTSGSGAGPGKGANPFPPVGVGRGAMVAAPVPRNIPGGR